MKLLPAIHTMKRALASLVIVLLGALALAQGPASAKPASSAAIEGSVTKEPGSEPVKKALVELIAENQREAGDYAATTGPDGAFRIEGVVPGRYRLFVERTGFLEIDRHHARSEGRVLTLTAGQELKDVQIRLQAAAVVRGRVTDEDGEPLPNAEVAVLRPTFASGHSRWQQAGAERTNDLGEFRVAGLPAGNYFVSVSPPPDFKSMIEAAGTDPGSSAQDKQAASYHTTYYPGTPDRSQAAPIQLHAGDEFPVNFSLVPSPSLSIRGSVANLPPRATATILLRSRDSDLVMNGADTRRDGSFAFPNVTPGTYTILATVDGSVPLMARQSIQVVNSVDGLRLLPQPGTHVRGRLRLETRGAGVAFDLSQMFLELRPADSDDDPLEMLQAAMGEGFGAQTHVAADGSFEWTNVPPGRYSIQFAGGAASNQDWFLKSAVAGGRDASESGITVNGGSVAVELVASANGGLVEGVVTDPKGLPVANGVIVAVPSRLRDRSDHFRKTVSDQTGRFALHGVPPGDYTLFAWESVDGDAYYDPEFLKSYEGQGSLLRLGESDRKSVQLQVIPEAEER